MSNIYTIYTELIIVIKLFRYYKYIRTRTPKIEYIGKRYIAFTEKTSRILNIPNKSPKTKIAYDRCKRTQRTIEYIEKVMRKYIQKGMCIMHPKSQNCTENVKGR